MNRRRNCRAFTLMELLVVIVIITILSSMVLFALYGAMQTAKRVRTQTQVMRLSDMVVQKWDTYKTRAVRLDIPQAQRGNALDLAAARMVAIRDLQRMELPDRITDLQFGPVAIPRPIMPSGTQPRLDPPSLWWAYRRRAGFVGTSTTAPVAWTPAHQGAECLYLIVSQTRDGDTSGLDFFKETEVGDTDNDGMPEILDAWGRPIEFLRWAPGFSISTGADVMWGLSAVSDINVRGEAGSDDEIVSDLHVPDGRLSPDPFDPLSVDDDLRSVLSLPARRTFALVPLIYSAGPDNIYDITSDANPTIDYTRSPPPPSSPPHPPALPVDPFYVIPAAGSGPEKQVGLPWDVDSDGELNSIDNVTNHLIVE